MYADMISDSMKEAIDETNRRRTIQEAYNEKYGITPTTIVKPINDIIRNKAKDSGIKDAKVSKNEKEKLMKEIEKEMLEAAKELDFERATELRDILFEMKAE